MNEDVRAAFRSLSRTKVLTGIVVLTLGLGIGMNTAVFSVVSAVLLKPMAYEDPGRLVLVRGRFPRDGIEDALLPGVVLAELRRSSTQLREVAGVAAIRQNLTGQELPVQVQVGWVSGHLFRMLGVGPALGRAFSDHEPPGRIMLDHGFWQRHFGADPDAVGRHVSLDGRPYEIVGVMPEAFRLELPRLPAEVDVWKSPDDWWQNGDVWSSADMNTGILRLVGRLAPGATVETARAELEAIAARLGEREAKKGGTFSLAVDPLHDAVVSGVRTTLWLLLGAAGCVLLIACANVANLQLVRGQRRAREIAVRLALGASRGRVVRLLLCEALALSLAGGGLGLWLGAAGLELLQALRPAELPQAQSIRLDATVLLFALASCVGATLLFGLLPALAATRRDVGVDLHGARSPLGPHRGRAGAALVAGQVALSVVLLLGGSLLGASFLRLRDVPLGFDPDRLLTFSVSLPGTRYERPLGPDRFLIRLEEAIEALPGVRSAGALWPLPLSGRRWSNVYEAGVVGAGRRAYADYELATPALFETLGLSLREGRVFSPTDPRPTVVVSRGFADRAFPGQSALGRTVQANPWGGAMAAFRIVGVVEDARYHSHREAPVDTLYFDSRGWSWTDWEVDVVVRASGDPQALVESIRREVARLDPQVPMARPRPMRELVGGDLAAHRFALTLLGVFALVAFVLAMVGLYGVVSWAVSQRTREIGIRLALGAPAPLILARVVGRGLRLAGLGAALGLLASAAATRLLTGLLYEVRPAEPAVVAGVVGTLLVAALVAAYVPARRAATLDPATTLRAE